MSRTSHITSPFPGNSSSFDNPNTYPDVEFVIPGFEKSLRLHTEILSKASLAFAHMFKGNDLAFCKFDQGAHRVKWTDTKAVSDKAYRNALEKVLRFCYGDSLTATADEIPVISSIFDQIQVQGKDTIKHRIDDFLASEKRKEELDKRINERKRKEMEDFLKMNSSVTRSSSYEITDEDYGHSALCDALKINATPTKTLDMECFGMILNAYDDRVVNYEGSWIGKELAEALNTNTTLTSLTVSVHPEGADAICKSLQTNTTLTFLSISIPMECNKYGEFGKELEPMLRINSTLKTLDIAGAPVGEGYVKPFCDALKTCHALETLKCNYNSKHAELIVGVLESNHGIKELGLDFCRENRLESKTIGRALKTNSTLTKLNLTSSSNIAEEVRDLAAGLKSNHSVTSLDLSCTWVNRHVLCDTLGLEGARGIGEILEANSTLTALNLFNTNLGNEGILAVVNGLKKNTSIRELNLGCNKAMSVGMIALFELLKANKTIASLDVSYTIMEKRVSAMIADVLKVNTSLKELNLTRCGIGEGSTKMIMEALRVNTTLTSLKYKGNRIGRNLCSSFDFFLKCSKTITEYEIDYAFDNRVEQFQKECIVM